MFIFYLYMRLQNNKKLNFVFFFFDLKGIAGAYIQGIALYAKNQ